MARMHNATTVVKTAVAGKKPTTDINMASNTEMPIADITINVSSLTQTVQLNNK